LQGTTIIITEEMETGQREIVVTVKQRHSCYAAVLYYTHYSVCRNNVADMYYIKWISENKNLYIINEKDYYFSSTLVMSRKACIA